MKKNKMENYTEIKKCRVCNSEHLNEVFKIDKQFLSPTFVKNNDNNPLSKIQIPMTLLLCDKKINPQGCGLLQLKESVNPNLLYKNYFYRTAINSTMCEDLKNVVLDVQKHTNLNDDDIVMDIGANDCTMISYFPKNLKRIGVEPAKNINWTKVDDSIVIVNDYFSKKVVDQSIKDKKVKIITCCAMFYDLDNPNKFVSEIKSILAPDGIWCIQLSYLSLMIKNINFYDICNEHLEYYSLNVLKFLMEKNGLTIVDASTNSVNGGSIRVFVMHSNKKYESENLKKLYEMEETMDLNNINTYKNFWKIIEEVKIKVKKYILNDEKTVLGLGASTKGNMLIQLFGITNKMMPYISERNPEKVGLKTLGTDIELISEDKARNINPDCMLVLPWYFKKEIVEREKEYLKKGGELVFPMPYPHVVKYGKEERL